MPKRAQEPETSTKVWKDEKKQGGDTSKIGKAHITEEQINEVKAQLGIDAKVASIDNATFQKLRAKLTEDRGDLLKRYDGLIQRRRMGKGSSRSSYLAKNKPDYVPYQWTGKDGKAVVLPDMLGGVKPMLKNDGKTIPHDNVSSSLIYGMVQKSNPGVIRRNCKRSETTRRAYGKNNVNIHDFYIGLGGLTGMNDIDNCGYVPHDDLLVDVHQVREGDKPDWWDNKLKTEVRIVRPNLHHPNKGVSEPIYSITEESKFRTKDFGLLNQVLLARRMQQAVPNNPAMMRAVLRKVQKMNARAIKDPTVGNQKDLDNEEEN